MSTEQSVKTKVQEEIKANQHLASEFSIENVKSGDWFLTLLSKVVSTYDKNVNAKYFQQKYPGLTPDEIADKLIDVTVKYASIAGGVAGAAITANQIALLSSAGATAALMAGSIGGEIIFLARLQMKLVLDLSIVYDLNLDPDDPEDILLIFGYALGIIPTEAVGKAVQKAAAVGSQQAIRHYISKGTLKSLQLLGQRIGIKILQRTIIKYAVPIVSAAVGSAYNYTTTKSLAAIAKTHLKNRGKVTDELRQLISKRNTYNIVFPASALFMAYADGRITPEEKELYKAVLSRLKLEEYQQTEFNDLLSSKEKLLDGLRALEDSTMKESLVRVVSLMAVYDGELHEKELELLSDIGHAMGIEIDTDKLSAESDQYVVLSEESFISEVGTTIKETSVSIISYLSNPFKPKNEKEDGES